MRNLAAIQPNTCAGCERRIGIYDTYCPSCAPSCSHLSPQQMLEALGWRLEFEANGQQARKAVIVRPTGKRFVLGAMAYDRAHKLLSRCMRIRGLASAGGE